MSRKKELMNLCVSMPNMGAFVYYLVFIFIVPIFIICINNLDLLLYYLPLLVPLAIILQESGYKDAFSNLYPLKESDKKDSYIGKISKVIISIVSVSAILYLSIVLGQKKNKSYGMIIGLTYLLIVFLLSPLLIPLVIKEGDKFVKRKGIKIYHNWHKYLFGFSILVALILLEMILVTIYDMIL